MTVLATRKARVGTGLLAALALSAALAAPASSAPKGPLDQSGRWITDADGRVVVLHGVNMVYKREPYAPAAAGFGADDARFLGQEGFNTVRLGVIYKGVERTPGSYDDAYLGRIEQSVDALAREGVFVQLDFHQDLYNERFQGEGWPDWAVLDGGLPAQPQLGFPANYFGMPTLSVAFDSFWANRAGPGGVGLQDRYAAAWRHVARRFRDKPGLMGYDLLNEPWPGTVWPTCANPNGCPNFERTTLTSFSRRVTNAIRQVDERNIVWYEPNVIFNNGPQAHHGDTGDHAGMSFHIYCLAEGFTPTPSPLDRVQEVACAPLENLPFQRALEQSARTDDALLLSEFGATDDLDQIERVIEGAERNMISWQYWHYCQCDDPTTSGVGPTQALVLDAAKPPSGSNVRVDKLGRLARAYPQAVAGTPERYDFDRARKRFSLAYSTKLPDGGRPAGDLETEIFVPRRHFEHGYRVDTEGARVVSAPDAQLLRLRNEPGAGSVEVRVRPAPFELAIGARKVKLDSRGRARVRVRCLFAEPGRSCSGRLKLRTANAISLRENGRRRKRSVRLGTSAQFELAAGSARTVTVTMAPRNARLARRRGRTAIRANTLDGGEPTAEQLFRLRAPR